MNTSPTQPSELARKLAAAMFEDLGTKSAFYNAREFVCDPEPEDIEHIATLIDSHLAPLREENERLRKECEADVHWIENLLCDVNAGRPLRPLRTAEGLTLRLRSLRTTLSHPASEPATQGRTNTPQ